jgi:guanosine-3',5'-bis(diphosphate) 3'-pyrophosphohydrolase
MNQKELAALTATLSFAAFKHRNQFRKGGDDRVPYINHPLDLVNVLVSEGGVTDLATLQAAACHDTVEDTDTSPAELVENFGDEVASIVAEVTDDKSLPKEVRKQRQIDNASHKSAKAALVSYADKICNLRDHARAPIPAWSQERTQAYFDWARAVADQLPKVNSALEKALYDALALRP